MMLKRTLDILTAGGCLVVLSPVFLVLAVLIHRQMGSPVLFRQTRPGRDGTPFEMIRPRSVRNALNAGGNRLPDAERLTRLGRFLRTRIATT